MPDTINHTLTRIGSRNRLLADELAKLPELNGFRSDTAHLALINLFRIYRFAPNRFDRMFSHMNAIGLAEHRKYCTPLQALLWMIQDQKLHRSGELLGLNLDRVRNDQGHSLPSLKSKQRPSLRGNDTAGKESDYSLTKILDAAWNVEAKLILGSTIHKIIGRIQADEEAEEYSLLAKRRSDLQLQGYIMDDFQKKKEIFNEKDWTTIEKALIRSRWKRFYTVADRLNSPELINYYINRNFFFRKTPASGVYFTFFEKKAQCTDAAYFAQFMLDRAGYRTFMRSVKWSDDPWDGLHTGAGIILDDGGYLLVSNYTGINAISGPYADVDDLDDKLSCQQKIIGRKWGAYYPPRFF